MNQQQKSQALRKALLTIFLKQSRSRRKLKNRKRATVNNMPKRRSKLN